MTTTIAIVNPKSAGGKTAQSWERVRKYLPIDAEIWHTKAPGHATELAVAALKTGAQTIIAAGGDGTINEVVNGFFEEDRLISMEAVLGIIPQGTGSDLRRSLELPSDPKEAAFIVGNGTPRMLDLMRVRYVTHEGQPGVRYAINMTSFGMGGEVAARMNRSLKTLGGKASFMIAAGVTRLEYSPRTVLVTLDETLKIETRITNVAVGNGQYHGAGMRVCPNARMDDGLLDVTVIGDLGLFEMSSRISMFYDGTILEHPKVQSHRAQHVHAESQETTLIEIDGEPVGKLPIEIQILPKTMRVLA